MRVDASVFKAYDIRGVVGRGIDEAFAEHLGRAFGSAAIAAGERAVAVGRDGRLSGPALAAALIRGLVSTGLDVVDLGAVTTPMLYYVAATRAEHGCRSGIQVTGSHNPKDYNGFKMVLAGRAIFGADIQGLRRRIEAEAYTQGAGRSAAMRHRATNTVRASSATATGAAAEDRRRLRQRYRRRQLARHPARAGQPGDRALQPGRWQLSQPPPGSEQAREPGRLDPRGTAQRRRTSAWPSTAMATGWAWSRVTARSSIPTGN